MLFILHLVTGEEIEHTFNSNSCVVGRSAKCDIVVPHDGMSRQHCLIELTDGGFFVTDLGSTNGVLIDGVKIPPHQKTPYALYLTLSFGAIQSFQILLEDPKARQQEVKANKDLTAAHHVTSPNLSKTKSLKQVPLSPGVKPVEIKDHSRIKFWLGNLLGLILLVMALWWYSQKDNESVEVETDQTETTYDGYY